VRFTRTTHCAPASATLTTLTPNHRLITQWVTAASAGAAAAGVVVTGAVPVSLRLAQPYTPRAPAAGTGEQEEDVSSWLIAQTDEAHGTAVLWPTDGAAPASPGADEGVLQTNYTDDGPGVVLAGGARAARHADGRAVARFDTRAGGEAEFVSFRTFLLVTDTNDPERAGLAVRRLYRLWAPHATENPIFFHATDTTDAGFKAEIDQMAATGFEMLIYSFGSGFNLEDASPANLARVKAQVDYARSKNIEVGGYDLICLDRGHGGYGGDVGAQWDAVAPDGSLKADACFASGWTDKLNNFVYDFVNQTGLSMLETDGPYGGGGCASHNHSYHRGPSDGVYMQTRRQVRLMRTTPHPPACARSCDPNKPPNPIFTNRRRGIPACARATSTSISRTSTSFRAASGRVLATTRTNTACRARKT
jgi:hypothetical protein